MSSDDNLEPGTVFHTDSGRRAGSVGNLLGAGGQGAVYEISLDGGRFALKWYHEHYIALDTGLRSRLSKAVERGAPDPRFLWPLEMVSIPGHASFGYVMPLRQAEYVGMRELIAPPPQRVELTLAQRARVSRHVAHCFLQLHASGFCYQDINFGNIFLHPQQADILVCDNDNVNIDGAPASIYGTRKFMAPEVVRRETLPCTKTDLFSMAVMFFYVMFGWHPLDGRREAEIRILDADAENRLYGTEPVFIFDDVNSANGPLEGMHDALVYRWQSLNPALRSLFSRSFTTGLFNPQLRIHEHEWRSVFDAIPAAVYQCAECGYENIAQLDDQGNRTDVLCGYCRRDPGMAALMQMGRRILVLQAGATLAQRDVDDSGADAPLARVEAHPEHQHVLGLRNLSNSTWRAEIPGYSATPINPGQTIRLLHGLNLELDSGPALINNPEDTSG